MGWPKVSPSVLFPRCTGIVVGGRRAEALLSDSWCAVRFLSFTLARVSGGLFHFDGVGANRAAHGGTHPGTPRLGSGYYS